MARWGAYLDAEKAYLQSKAPQQQLLLRRLALAEAMGDESRVGELAAKLNGEDPEVRMRVSLARATLAARAWRFADARNHYREAGLAAAKVNTPEVKLVGYAIDSHRTIEGWEQGDPPTVAQFQQAHQKVVAPLAGSGYPTYPPLDYTRAAHWGRMWVVYALSLGYERPQEWSQWSGVAESYAQGAIATVLDRAIKANDPEAGSVSMHYALDMVEWLPPQQAVSWLAQVKRGLDQGDAFLATQSARLGNPYFLEQQVIRARYFRALAVSEAQQQKMAQAIKGWEEAGRLFAEARRPLDQADVYWQASLVLSLGGPSWANQAAAYAEKALALARRLDYLFVQAYSLERLGWIRLGQGNYPAAEKALRESVGVQERMVVERGGSAAGHKRLLSRSHSTYEGLIQALLAQGKKVEAAEVLRRREARELLSAVSLEKVNARDPKVQQALAKVQRSRQRSRSLSSELAAERARPQAERRTDAIHRIEGELASSKAEFHQALNLIKRQDPDYDRLVSIRPTSFSKIQPKLPADTALVQFFAGEQKLYIFLATRSDLKAFEVPVTRKTLKSLVRKSRRAITRRQSTAALTQLHQYLIKPIATEIEGVETLAIAPSDFLYYLPFAALKGEQYLVQEKRLAIVTGLEVLSLFDKPGKPAKQGLLALGDPDGSLPEARAEVKELAALFPGNNTVYVADQATKERVLGLPSGTTVLHLATHGVVHPRDVNASYLLMAGSGAQSRLTTGEIYGLDLRQVNLVTLSACETAIGEQTSHPEVATLAQAFSVAGSPSMVASLWKVADDGTRALMLAFYRQLLAGSSRGEALRLAQLELLATEKFSDPYYWAAFELIGDWR